MLMNLIVGKQLPRLNERLIFLTERYQTYSMLMLARYVCALPCSTVYDWNLIATIAS